MRYLRVVLVLSISAAIALIGGSVLQAPGPEPGAGVAVWTPITLQTLSHGRFENFTVFAPHATPRGFVLLMSGADGWTPRLRSLALQLAGRGAMVAGIDGAQFDAKLEADPAGCVFPDGDLENLSHFVQAYYRLPTYLTPILAGESAGAALAYATLAQSPANTFAGAVSMQFCPVLELRKPLCKSAGLDFNPRATDAGVDLLPDTQIGSTWVVLEPSDPAAQTPGAPAIASQTPGAPAAVSQTPAAPAAVSQTPGAPAAVSRPQSAPPACGAESLRSFVAKVPGAQLVLVPGGGADVEAAAAGAPAGWAPPYADAFDRLMAHNAPAPTAMAPRALGDLPIVPVATHPGVTPSDTFAIMLSGDGGWAGLDKDVAAALTADGISVVGLDSLRYFWSARTPQGLAADLDRMIRYYLTELGKRRVVLIGYSQGADVLPFAVNRLSAAARAHVALVTIMGMSEHALFEFHMSSWISDDNSGPATLPEVDKMTGIPVLCIYGEDETDTLCPQLDPHKATVVKLKGGHHFDGNYDGLARTIIAAAAQR